MILTPNSDCTEILVQSSSFNADNIANRLYVSINGGTTIEVLVSNSATNYTITTTSLNIEKLEPGVYEVLLVSALDSSAIENDLGCTVLLCDYECDVDTLALYKDSANIDKILAYEGLKNFAGCSTCDCTLANVLHSAFTNTTTTNATSCGCGQA